LHNRGGQFLAEEEAVLVAVAISAVAAVSGALLVAVPALRQFSMVAALEKHRLSGGHTLPVEVSADQMSHLDLTMAAPECLL